MTKREAILRYHLIINKVRDRNPNFEELYNYLDKESMLRSCDFRISQRTLQRDLRDIREIYNIDIQYDFSKKHYFIDNENNDSNQERMFEAFDILDMINFTDGISKHIHFEQRKSQNTNYLTTLLQAIKTNKITCFEHRRHYRDAANHLQTEPLGVKEYRNRWYLVARNLVNNEIKPYPFDRIEKITVTDKTFLPPSDFDLDKFFEHSFGVMIDNGKPIKVELSFTPFQGNYIKNLPLHHSQKILFENEKEIRVQLFVHNTIDFQMELMSMLPEFKVIEPKSLKDTIKNKVEKAAKIL